MLEIMVRYSGGYVLEEFLTDLDLARITLSFQFALNKFWREFRDQRVSKSER